MLLSLAGLFERWLRQIIVSEAYLYSLADRGIDHPNLGRQNGNITFYHLSITKQVLSAFVISKMVSV